MAHKGPKKGMTIEKVKEMKIGLETEIMKLLKDFESETGVYTGYLNIEREQEEVDIKEAPIMQTSTKEKDIINVDVNMELDLIF